MVYPTFQIVEGRHPIPAITLPPNFRELVPRFYEQKRREDVDDYTVRLNNVMKNWREFDVNPRLVWDEKLGLKHINVGMASGLDLNSEFGWPHFQEHNIGLYHGIIAGMIGTYYISELIKSAPQT